MKQFTLKSLLLVLTILMGGVNAWGEEVTKSWDLTAASADWVGSGNVTYFTQPYGFKKVDGTLMNKSIDDFNIANKTSIKVGFKCLQNGATTSKLTIFLVDVNGNKIGNGVEVTPVNANSAAKTTYQYATFSTDLENASGFMMQVTTFGKNILVNGAEYTINYELSEGEILPPTFSLAEGTYWKEQTLELTTTVEGGTILYTTDKSDPTTSKTAKEYPGPIQISETTTVMACVKDADNFSDVAKRTYTIFRSIANTQQTAYTTAKAIELIDTTSAAQLAGEKVYVKGVVSKVESYNSTYGSITYWLDDGAFEVYSGKGLDNANFKSKDDIKFGAEVIVYGNIKKFNSTYEFDKNNYLVSYVEPNIELNFIEVSGTPNTTAYEENASFSCSGLVVTANYSDGSTQDVTGNVTWSVDPETLIAGTTQVTVTATYEGKSDSKTFDVTVIIPQPVEANSIIVAEYEKDGVTKHAAMTTKLNDKSLYLYSTEIIKAGDKYIVTGEINDILFRTETIDGKTTIQNIADGKYLQATAAKNISFTDLPYSWTNDGEKLTAANSDYGTLQYNTSAPRFTTYGSKVGQYATIVDMSNVVSGAVLTLLATDGTANYATFSSDSDVEFVDATVYAVNVVNGVLQLNEVTSKQVPAGTGVLLQSENETAPYFYIDEAATIGNNLLKPASEEMSGSYTFYKLAYDDYAAQTGLGFYWGKDDGGKFTVKAGTAYLAVPNAASVKGFLLDGTPTAIE
ncbi:MAG: chitobiase/beta-hexosaminidase C-terminal domain-containing protein, partial [Bacteroidaceae bacterium]|nr:chitobiase/beta-hexosaminidase C-terminal domain-containing protein [Paraprevotella sp.]MDY2715818.1 chitobiase/beta-hexosaminidase C-terminal domain-containing protein [Bacteroidaceae bacterium]